MSQSYGFTLLEVLITVAILTMLVGISLPVYESFVRRNDLDLTAQSVAASMRRAETYARGVNRDATWGVAFAQSGVTVFKGASYAARDTTLDETISLPSSMTISGLSEVVFAKLTATPSTTGNVVLTSTTNDTRTISINAEGMVNY